MKKINTLMMAATLSVGVLAAGCQTTTSITAPMTQTVTPTALQAHNWQLVDAKYNNGERITPLFFDPTKPLLLNVMADRIALMNTCNNMSASYTVKNGDVQLGNGISTMMACPTPQANFDTAAMATVHGNYSISKNANNVPILTIKGTDRVAYFKAVAK